MDNLSDIRALGESKRIHVFNPFNKEDNLGDPGIHAWEGALIINCLEYMPEFMERALLLKEALVSLKPAIDGPKLIVVVKSGKYKISEDDLNGLLYYAGAKKVWKPGLFKNIEDVCLVASLH